jgi:hypothetical protein
MRLSNNESRCKGLTTDDRRLAAEGKYTIFPLNAVFICPQSSVSSGQSSAETLSHLFFKDHEA